MAPPSPTAVRVAEGRRRRWIRPLPRLLRRILMSPMTSARLKAKVQAQQQDQEPRPDQKVYQPVQGRRIGRTSWTRRPYRHHRQARSSSGSNAKLWEVSPRPSRFSFICIPPREDIMRRIFRPRPRPRQRVAAQNGSARPYRLSLALFLGATASPSLRRRVAA